MLSRTIPSHRAYSTISIAVGGSIAAAMRHCTCRWPLLYHWPCWLWLWLWQCSDPRSFMPVCAVGVRTHRADTGGCRLPAAVDARTGPLAFGFAAGTDHPGNDTSTGAASVSRGLSRRHRPQAVLESWIRLARDLVVSATCSAMVQACLAMNEGDSGLQLYVNFELFWIIKFWITKKTHHCT